MGAVVVVGIGADAGQGDAARAALEAWRARNELFSSTPVASWTAPDGHTVVHWTTHPPSQVGGVDYVQAEADGLALFTGRPFFWDADHADGRSGLDPSRYRAAPSTWVDRVDGAALVLRVGRDAVETWTDPQGMQPLYLARARGVTWLSNAAPVLYDLVGRGPVRTDALAAFLTVGWGLTGQPLWEGVERVPRGVLSTFRGASVEHRPVGAEHDLAALFAGRADFDEAARTLVEATAALADWPGRPNIVPMTGGRDSRLVLAAARAAGVEFDASTVAFRHLPGYPETPDVVVARRVCAALGIDLDVTTPVDAVYDDPARVLRELGLRSPGTQGLADATTLQLERVTGPLPLVHVGLGGEFARAFFGNGQGLDRSTLPPVLLQRIASSRAGVANERARGMVLDWLRGFVDDQLDRGVSPADVPDALYLHRVANWAATNAMSTAARQDSVMPLVSRRLLPHQLGLSLEARAQEVFHLEVLRRLSPELVGIPFEGSKPYWPSMRSPLRRELDKAVIVGRRKRDALRRRVARPPGVAFGKVVAFAREAVAAQPDHEVWALLDTAKVEAVLATEPGLLDASAQQQIWRLATVFGQAEPDHRPGGRA